MEFVCDECAVSFCNNQNRLRHIRTKHQGMKRMDNEKKKRKRDSHEIAHAKRVKIDNTTAVEDNIVVIPSNTAIVVIPSNSAIVVKTK